MEDINDEDAARRVQQGDVNAFSLLVGRYEAKITRYGRKFLSRPDDIKDIVQEIFTKTFVNIRSFDAKRKFSPWIYRIAHNEFVNALKKKKTEKLAFVDFDACFPIWRQKRPPTGMWIARICGGCLINALKNCRRNIASR
jgi:RNA polymerase sigma-70 factor (ECF subfamily)